MPVLGRALSGRIQHPGFGTAAADIVRVPGCPTDKDTNGVEAVAQATRTRYNLILMNLSMPEMDGPEATQRLRAAGASKTSALWR